VGDGFVSRGRIAGRSRQLAIDVGSANTLLYQHGAGIVYDEPTIVAVHVRSGRVVAVGHHASEVARDNPGSILTQRPLRRGVITDFDVTQQMIKLIFRRLGVGRFGKPKAVVTIPTSITAVEQRAVEEVFVGSGARAITMVEEPLAAAIGAGLPVQDPIGNLVVDVGGGTTEIALVAMGGVVKGASIPVGGFDMDAAVREHVRSRYGIAIGDVMAERLKIVLGSAYPTADARPVEVPGRSMDNAVPTSVTVTPEEMREALSPQVRAIAETARECLSESPPELAHDVLEHGIFLTGGGGMLQGMEMRLSRECEVPVHLTDDPLRTVVLGAGRLLGYLPEYQAALASARSWS
jgi:rod shape-determining protein MreB and related proteins